MQHHCSLSVHDDSVSEADVVLNLSLFPPGALIQGEVVRLVAIDEPHFRDAGSSVLQNHIAVPRRERQDQDGKLEATVEQDRYVEFPGTGTNTSDDLDLAKGYIFQIKDMGPEMLARSPDVQLGPDINVIAGRYSFRMEKPILYRSHKGAMVETSGYNASHVEVVFKEEYLTRADMWHLAMAELADRTVYKGQKIWFLRTIKASVSSVFLNGRKVQSALFCASTKPIFRSESARYVLFIQMSKEMWDFDASGNGELIFNQVTDGFLPELFVRWQRLKVKHIITVVLFTRIAYETQLDGQNHADFYRIVASDMASREWETILSRLRSEFKVFLREVSIQRPMSGKHHLFGTSLAGASNGHPDWIIAGKPCTAARGNLLEAINLASSQFSFDHVDRDLVRTGVSLAVVTPGAGLFEADHQLLATTTENLVANGIGIDLICLSRMPLHSVPLFKYKRTTEDNQNKSSMQQSAAIKSDTQLPTHFTRKPSGIEWSFGIPYWVDVSFWTSHTDRGRRQFVKPIDAPSQKESSSSINKSKNFRPRVRMYELQMMGVMEDMTGDLCIPFIRSSHGAEAQCKTDTSHNDSNISFNHARSVSQVFSKSSSEWQSPKYEGLGGLGTDQMAQYMAKYDEEVFRGLEARWLPRNKYQYPAMAGLSNAQSEKRYPPQNTPSPYPTRLSEHTKYRSLAPDHHDKTSDYPSIARVSTASGTSAETVKQDLPTRPNKSMRQINFGFRGFGVTRPKAVASTELTAEHAKPESRGPRKQSSKDDRINVYTTDNSLIASTSGPSTGYSSDSGSVRGSSQSLSAEDQGTSRPIPIRKATAFRVKGDDDTNSKKRFEQLNREGQTISGDLSSHTEASDEYSCVPEVPIPDHDLDPWLVVLNPSNPKVDIYSASHLGKWQHVFPRSLRASKMKWKSLCSPAAVPITTEDLWPSKLAEGWQQQAYRIEPAKDDVLSEPLRSRDWLLKEMISLRLSYGFQVLVKSEGPSFCDPNLSFGDQFDVQLSKGRIVHRLQRIEADNIGVTCFNRGTATTDSHESMTTVYRPFIRTILANTYTSQVVHLSSKHEEHDWRKIDAFLAGRGKKQPEELLKGLQFWRARFVLIPVDTPVNSRRPAQTFNEDNEEEIRLEGIRKLTQIWQRFRYLSPDERRFHASTRTRKDTNPLDIMYQTRNPSAIIAAEKEGIDDTSATGEPVELLPESELFQRSNLNLETLAHTMQSEKGVRMMDRRWHFILHYNCFIGFELTTWLLQNFRDVDTREEAVDLGNELMANGLFQHVQQRHNFRDGNFFYQVASEYRAPRAETKSWFGSRKPVSATPVSEGPGKGSPVSYASRPTFTSDEKPDNNAANHAAAKQSLGVALSKSLIYDVDHRKKSHRPELINLHYDRLHNPDNCYHIRIDWMSTTPKLIEDAIVSWSTTVDRFGLRLVEVPLAEASAVTSKHPFRAPYIVHLARQPPSQQPKHYTYFDAKSFAASVTHDKLYYQKLLLKKFDYVLDFEAAGDFPPDVDVSYSWGKPNYKYVQYIHRSGSLVAQITDDGDFLLLANRLYNNHRIANQEERPMRDSDTHGRAAPNIRTSGYHGSPRASPFSSPIIRAIPGMSKSNVSGSTPASATPEQLKADLEDFCSNETALDAFYSDALNKLSPTGRRTPFQESTIPQIGLPASLALADDQGVLDLNT